MGDKQIIARALDVILCVSEANLAKSPAERGATVDVLVSRRRLLALVREIEREYPGVIDRVRHPDRPGLVETGE